MGEGALHVVQGRRGGGHRHAMPRCRPASTRTSPCRGRSGGEPACLHAVWRRRAALSHMLSFKQSACRPPVSPRPRPGLGPSDAVHALRAAPGRPSTGSVRALRAHDGLCGRFGAQAVQACRPFAARSVALRFGAYSAVVAAAPDWVRLGKGVGAPRQGRRRARARVGRPFGGCAAMCFSERRTHGARHAQREKCKGCGQGV